MQNSIWYIIPKEENELKTVRGPNQYNPKLEVQKVGTGYWIKDGGFEIEVYDSNIWELAVQNRSYWGLYMPEPKQEKRIYKWDWAHPDKYRSMNLVQKEMKPIKWKKD